MTTAVHTQTVRVPVERLAETGWWPLAGASLIGMRQKDARHTHTSDGIRFGWFEPSAGDIAASYSPDVICQHKIRRPFTLGGDLCVSVGGVSRGCRRDWRPPEIDAYRLVPAELFDGEVFDCRDANGKLRRGGCNCPLGGAGGSHYHGVRVRAPDRKEYVLVGPKFTIVSDTGVPMTTTTKRKRKPKRDKAEHSGWEAAHWVGLVNGRVAWQCPSCKSHNDAEEISCLKCDELRDDLTPEARMVALALQPDTSTANIWRGLRGHATDGEKLTEAIHEALKRQGSQSISTSVGPVCWVTGPEGEALAGSIGIWFNRAEPPASNDNQPPDLIGDSLLNYVRALYGIPGGSAATPKAKAAGPKKRSPRKPKTKVEPHSRTGPWSDAEIKRLREMAGVGKSNQQIARSLQRPESAVRAKRKRLADAKKSRPAKQKVAKRKPKTLATTKTARSRRVKRKNPKPKGSRSSPKSALESLRSELEQAHAREQIIIADELEVAWEAEGIDDFGWQKRCRVVRLFEPERHQLWYTFETAIGTSALGEPRWEQMPIRPEQERILFKLFGLEPKE